MSHSSFADEWMAKHAVLNQSPKQGTASNWPCMDGLVAFLQPQAPLLGSHRQPDRGHNAVIVQKPRIS